MQSPNTQDAGYTVVAHGLEIRCGTVEQVVGAVKALSALDGESDREVPLANGTEPSWQPVAERDLARLVEDIVRAAPRPLRPIEIVKALKKRGVSRRDATYTRVYAVLRYGAFEKDGGRWSVAA